MKMTARSLAQLLLWISRSYSVVRNSRAACWRWLFRKWKFRRFDCSQDGFNLFAGWYQRLWFKWWVVSGDDSVGLGGSKVVKSCP